MKINRHILIFAAAAALLAGCATNDHSNSGAMGNDTETGVGTAQSPAANAGETPEPFTPAPAPNAPTGDNGSIGRGNPFGAGDSLQRQ